MTLAFTHDLDIISVHHHAKFDHSRSNGSRDLVIFSRDLVIFSPMNYFLVTDGQTDKQTDRRKATHKSPPYMSTGGLKNAKSRSLHYIFLLI